MRDRLRMLLSSHGASLFGGERVLLAIARGLLDRGHEVTLEFPHEGPALAMAEGLPGADLWLSRRPRLPRNGSEGLAYLAGLLPTLRRLRKRIRNRYDVVWVNSLYNPVAALAARTAGVPVVWHLHERNMPSIAGRAAAQWIRLCADLTVVVSQFVGESFVAAGVPDTRCRVMHNALLRPITPAPLRARRNGYRVGSVGQFEPQKRVGDLLEAVARLPDVFAVVVGDGKARTAVQAAVQQKKLSERVQLVGYQENIQPFLHDSDCVVLPSKDEGFGLVALEAMAAGRPVIAADSGAFREVLGDAALFYSVGDISALVDQIARLRADPDLAVDLRQRGLRRVSDFTLDRMVLRVEEIAREAIAGPAAGLPLA